MIKTGVVIVTFNRLELLKECVDNVSKQTTPFDEIIIVDNKSTDGTIEYLKGLLPSDVYNIVFLEENIGGSGGFYEGLRKTLNTDLDWVLLIDDDAIINLDFNEKILDNIKSNNETMAYSGTVIADNRIDLNHRRIQRSKNSYKDDKVALKKYEENHFDYDFATFCGLYVSMRLIKKIGLPIKEFFIWYDDTEYSYRIKEYSKIRNINSAIINHKCKIIDTSSQFSWKNYYGRRNQMYIIKKYHGIMEIFKYSSWLFFAMLKHYINYFLSHNQNIRYKAVLTKDALIDGLTSKLGKNNNYIPKADSAKKDNGLFDGNS